VAGAICPECSAMDRLVLEKEHDSGVARRRCVACGYTDTLDSPASLSPRTRLRGGQGGGLDKPAAQLTQPVRILDPAVAPDSDENSSG
jgi:uncharacterized metal-binding protein (TIGR02443 family)